MEDQGMRTKLTTDDLDARKTTGKAFLSSKVPIIGCLDNVRSLYNVGSMFRTADAVGMTKLILAGYTPAPPRKEIVKTALGATETVTWEKHDSVADVLSAVRDMGATLCVLEQTSDSIPYTALTGEHFPLCIVVGNELTGVRSDLVGQADVAIEIPMLGAKHSLNAAVAFGIAAFEALRIWRGAGSPLIKEGNVRG
jgi:tRNA G18 (ribose-2'-O)-methylase SpoU